MSIHQPNSSRRQFIKTASISGLSLAIPDSVLSFFGNNPARVTFGVISDLHVDIIHDAEYRLTVFLDEMEKKKPDAIIQLGDFAIPKTENQQIINRFNQSSTSALHVLGNHDMDGGFTRDQTVNAFGMPGRYYSVVIEGVRVIVLDGNDSGSPSYSSGYPSYIGSDQQKWLAAELDKSQMPVLIVSHQPIAGIYTIDNALEIQEILSNHADKILLAINGHAHVDQHVVVGGINYVHINSASYYWVGQKLEHESLTPEVHARHPSLKFTCPYSEPLFGLLTIDPAKKSVSLKGKKTLWVGPSPLDLGYQIVSPELQRLHVQPQISDRAF
jgi:3',5'-cyclic-AMP phosphodiesterase